MIRQLGQWPAQYNDRKKTLVPPYILATPHKQPVAILPLTLVLALHLTLALLWSMHVRTPRDQGAVQRSFTLTWLRAPQSRPPPPLPPPRPPATRVARPVATPAAVAPQPAPTPAAELVDQVAPTQRDDASRPPAPGALDVRQLMEAAKRQVGVIDHDLRGGKLAPLAPDRELPIARLRGGLASAHIDRSRTTVTESMRQADGVVVYRFRRGDKVWCRQSGGISSSIERSDGATLAGAGSAGGAGTAGTIPCPGGDAGWSRL